MPYSIPPIIQRQHGFTLLEILVVITIIGILAGLALLTSGGSDRRQLLNEAQRLRQVLDMAADEAAFSHRNLGFKLQNKRYFFLQFDEESQQWRPLDEPPWQGYQLPNFISISLTLRGEAGTFDLAQDKDGDTEDGEPTLLMLASGENTPFALHFALQTTPESPAIVSISSDGFSSPQLLISDDIDERLEQ